MYGFSCYAKSDIGVNLLFAKAKTAPAKSKSLPTLELLAVFLALKCLPTILNALTVKIESITICVDAQVVLSWVLTGNIKTKNVFANNRLKDIMVFLKQVETNYGVTCKFKYVPTEHNPADLLTRGTN